MEVFLEEAEVARDENVEESDELRPSPAFAVALAAGSTILEEGGAGPFFFIGSPAVSAGVLLFDAGSGSSHELSKQYLPDLMARTTRKSMLANLGRRWHCASIPSISRRCRHLVEPFVG